ncbi:MAG: hypothetical protein ACLSFZ_01785 [Frisingicoccus sp.]
MRNREKEQAAQIKPVRPLKLLFRLSAPEILQNSRVIAFQGSVLLGDDAVLDNRKSLGLVQISIRVPEDV